METKDSAQRRAYKLAWYHANKERVDARVEAWRAEHADQVREYKRKWAANNPPAAQRNPERVKERRHQAYLRHREETIAAQRAYRARHLEESRARDKAYRAANAEKCAASWMAWRAAHPEARKAIANRYASAHRFQQRELLKEWRRNHPEEVAAAAKARLEHLKDQSHRKRARKRAAFVETVIRSFVYERDNGRCGICGKKVRVDHFQLDHILPLARGGEHSYKNVQLAHPKCNYSKGARATIPQQLRLVG